MKRALPFFTLLFVLCFFCLAVLHLGFEPLLPVSATPAAHPLTIIIDPGHGGFDGGTTSVSGVAEKEYNLAIALKIADFLRANGYSVIMTRTTDTATNDPDLQTIRQKKSSDLHNRLAMMDSYENCLFISVHQNYFEDASCQGAQVFYSPNLVQSKLLAELIQKSIVALVEPDNTRAVKKSDSSIFLLYQAQIPAVMVECGFLSNPMNAKKLADQAFQQKIAFAICEGIEQYLISEEHNGTEK